MQVDLFELGRAEVQVSMHPLSRAERGKLPLYMQERQRLALSLLRLYPHILHFFALCPAIVSSVCSRAVFRGIVTARFCMLCCSG
jgi:hypothetical protein